ncbi:M15 family metallopeptidase [Solibacillus cecembensis]|uniref:M15 family metallopeptidase n=1 Tax=Solibacillus cecembensis TaxID=459347 RepID=UPI003D06EA63
MNVTTTCRDLAELTQAAQLACRLLFQECYKAGIVDVFLTETYRSPERQKYLYALGRTRPGQIVTWTLNSNHSGRLAWDIAVGPPKSLYDLDTLNKVGAIAAKLGITWGGHASWVNAGKTDRPHFEVKANWAPPKGYKLEGQVIVPSNSKFKVQLIVKYEPQQIEEDDETMKFTSATTKNAVRDELQQAVDKELIDGSWLEKFDEGTMTNGDYAGLKRIISQRSVTK